ncbi:hypothetical protein D9619_012460 [Psilocybe cf. subviscida]|uniref:Uncharacterized protein n=1 Tax=Psilocybe cf. subviscida TaxID=2480587 RepID=A0A8H5AR45_9AGAR|nr:hypothetical protein D9619_012460 [Psilocybe cf. subviscida]
MSNAHAPRAGPPFNLKRPRNTPSDERVHTAVFPRPVKRHRVVYKLDSNNDLVERIHISSDAEDDVDRIVREEMAAETLDTSDNDINPMPTVDEIEIVDRAGILCSERSRGKTKIEDGQYDEEHGEAKHYDPRNTCGHIEEDDKPETVEDDKENVYGEEPTIKRQPTSAGEHEHRRHLRLYHVHPLPNSYNSSTGESYNTEPSGSSSSSSEREETPNLERTEAMPLRALHGGKLLQALMTIVPIEWTEEEDELELERDEDCDHGGHVSVGYASEEEGVTVAAQISAAAEDFSSFLGDDALDPFSPAEIQGNDELSDLLGSNHLSGFNTVTGSSLNRADVINEDEMPDQRLAW